MRLIWAPMVPAGCWFASHVVDWKSFAVVGCTVAPGFEFEDFEMGKRDELAQEYPEHHDIIWSLTREQGSKNTLTLFGLHGDLHGPALAGFEMQGWVGWVRGVRIEPILVAFGGHFQEEIRQRTHGNFPVTFGSLREISCAGAKPTAVSYYPDHKAVDRFAAGAVGHGKCQHGRFRAHLHTNMSDGVCFC